MLLRLTLTLASGKRFLEDSIDVAKSQVPSNNIVGHYNPRPGHMNSSSDGHSNSTGPHNSTHIGHMNSSSDGRSNSTGAGPHNSTHVGHVNSGSDGSTQVGHVNSSSDSRPNSPHVGYFNSSSDGHHNASSNGHHNSSRDGDSPSLWETRSPGALAASSKVLARELNGAEYFNGSVKVGNESIPLWIWLATVAGAHFGTLDSHGVRDLPMQCFKDNATWTLMLPSETLSYFTLNRSGDTLSGFFTRDGRSFPAHLSRRSKEKTSVAPSVRREVEGGTFGPKRPQEPEVPYPYDLDNLVVEPEAPYPYDLDNLVVEPEAPYPYDSDNLVVPTRDGHLLAGTLVMPRNATRRVPIVVLVPGGTLDRNSTIMDHKLFPVLSDLLARQGIASFRYDKRGVGESGGLFENATTMDFAHDAAAALDHVMKDPRADVARSGMVGHGEGGAVAAIVGAGEARGYRAMRPRFIAMIAAPGAPGVEILADQMIRERTVENVTNLSNVFQPTQNVAALQARVDMADEVTIRERTRAFIVLLQMLSNLAVDEENLGQLVNSTVAWHTFPRMQYIRFDPRPYSRKLNMPVLVVNGMLDVVTWQEPNVAAMEGALRQQ